MYILGTLYGAFGESSWSVYEYSTTTITRVNRKSMKCLRSIKILSHFFDASSTSREGSAKNKKTERTGE